ncbi:MAG: hypothetical protein KF799_02575 [Bdellovibrionales bacterium]|nr:hypothetical protein [Bdellovibrionales bacterium]
MKALAYTIFVISVLLVSGFARADLMTPFVQQTTYTTPVHIDDVTVAGEMQLKVDGYLPNPCFADPIAVLTEDPKHANTLVLNITSPLPTQDACMQVTKPYSRVVDLPFLVRTALLQLDPQTVYVIRTEGFDFAIQAYGAELMH